jgi:ribosomal protein S18 acetylase RimI-like enzyme
MTDIAVRRMSPELIDDWLDLFDHRAFTDNADWAGCYCMSYLTEGEVWDTSAAERNRSAAVSGFASGEATGMVAVVDESVVGWTRFGAKQSFPGLRDRTASPEFDNDAIASIVCFVIDPMHRRRGIARLLLDGACEEISADGFAAAEAYPAREPADDAQAFHGPLEMFLGAGFSAVLELDRVTVVQRRLR